MKSRDENMCQYQEPLSAWVVFIETPQNSSGDQLTQGGTGIVDILAVVQVRLLVQELDPIHQQAINCSVVIIVASKQQ